MNRVVQSNDDEQFRVRRFSLGQLMLLIFNIACFVSFTRFAYVSAIGPYSSLDFVLGVVCLVLFPIGVGMMNRGSFATMVASFAIAVCSWGLVRYLATGIFF